jgi:cytochrome c553
MNRRLFAALAAFIWTLAAHAAGDIEQGRARSLACQACHGANGQGTAPDIPNLAAQKAPYLAAQLTAFRSKERKHDLMNAIAVQLSDADIANLAAFWSSVPAGGAAAGGAAAADPAVEFRKSRMTFPADFPAGYVKYAEDERSRSWANKVAAAAAKARGPLPLGSAIVVENVKDGLVVSYAAMESRKGWGDGVPELIKNGDWSYALFDGKKALRDFNYARCLACHKPRADTQFVFGYDLIAK